MKLLQVVASALAGLAVAAALAAVPDIAAPALESDVPAARPVAAQAPWAPATSVSADTRPTASTDAEGTKMQRAVAAAVRSAVHTAQVPESAYSVRSIHVADDATWATAVLVPIDPDALEPAVALAQRRGQRWQLADLGTFEVGCDLAPAEVLRELRLDCG